MSKIAEGFSITSPGLPGAVFYSYEALRAHVDDEMQYVAAVRAFANDHDDDIFATALAGLAYECSDIAWHIANPGKFMPRGFM